MKAVERFDPASVATEHLRPPVIEAIDQARPGQSEQNHSLARSSRRQNFEDAPRLLANERGAWPRTDR